MEEKVIEVIKCVRSLKIVDNYEELSQFHYLFYNFYSRPSDRDKKNSPFILIDIDAEIQSERDEVLNEISGDEELSKRLPMDCDQGSGS